MHSMVSWASVGREGGVNMNVRLEGCGVSGRFLKGDASQNAA
jgi:hypothetical protein